MTVMRFTEAPTSADLLSQQQSAWERQRQVVVDKSVFYRKLWQGLAPPKDLRDLPNLPLSDKKQLRASQAACPPFGDYLASPAAHVARLHRTSGTTGQAMTLALSKQDCEVTEMVGGRCFRAAGLTTGHRVVHCLNYQMWIGGLTDHLCLERTGATVIPFGVGSSRTLIQTILELGVTAISCTPSYPAVLERVLEEQFSDVRPSDLGLKLGLFGGEPGLDDPALRQRISDTWGIAPRNANYGVSDVLSIFAAQCEHDTRLHFFADHVLYPELIDPDTAAPRAIEAGQRGELVLTHLMRDCQPLVRFRTGDIIAVDETEPCACGQGGMRFRVVGRSDDMVVVRGLNLYPTMVSAVVATFSELSGDFRIVLDHAPPYDFLPLQVELAKGQNVTRKLAGKVEQAIKTRLGASAKVSVLPAASFAGTPGKTPRVVRRYA